jgi:predicted nucleic acid-binding protein
VRRGLLTQLWTDEQLQVEAWEILKKFREHKLSLTDATSVALIERFRLDAITSFDQDFKKIGITTLP